MSNFCLLAVIWLNKIWQKKVLQAPTGGSEKWFSCTCRRTWCGHSRVKSTNDHVGLRNDDTVVSEHVVFVSNFEKAMNENLFFDQCSSASLCLDFLEARGLWLSLRGHFFSFPWQTEIAKGSCAFVFGWGRGEFDQASLWWHFTFSVVTVFFFFLFLYFSFRLWKSEGFDRADRRHLRREAGGARSSNGRWSSPFLSFSCSLCSYPLSPQSLSSEGDVLDSYKQSPSSPSTRKKNITDRSGIEEQYSQRRERSGHFSSAGRHSWEHCGMLIRSLPIARALVVVLMPLAGDDTHFFWRRLESIRRLSSTIAPKLLVFQAPNLLTYTIDDCALLSSAFEVLFPGFWCSKTLKNGIARTINYIL